MLINLTKIDIKALHRALRFAGLFLSHSLEIVYLCVHETSNGHSSESFHWLSQWA